ncbi:putative RNA-directed DNA polymerase from transposon BS [Trichonephila inaurata madagascariensis]|uniref:Putative RNA-directed DNA polymerase from transposon BS n=1 Tax=Trichonephila inaurata madagascariensis TaxID=2747483 RepID=A0A8X6KNK3_9ARAC|nr:putative RNA-directed DNA polymerase from transposon BS [Trichonephila inaurata madagascariensis]
MTNNSSLHYLKKAPGVNQDLSSQKRLSGVTWGSTQDVLCTAYKCHVRPVVEYGNEVLITASDSVRNRGNLFLNSMLRLITGGTKSTPIAAAELLTDLEPLRERSQKSALNLVGKILRRRNNFLNYPRPTNERLKTHKSFLSTVHDLYDTYDIPTPNRQVFPREFNLIMCHVTLESHLDLFWNVGKQFSIQSD